MRGGSAGCGLPPLPAGYRGTSQTEATLQYIYKQRAHCNIYTNRGHTAIYIQTEATLQYIYKQRAHCNIYTNRGHTAIYIQTEATLQYIYKQRAHCNIYTNRGHTAIYMYIYIYGQIPQNGLTLGSCPQRWGSHYYIIFKIFLIDGLYSVIW